MFSISVGETEGEIKNGQSRETGNIGYTRRRQTKQKTQRNMCCTPPYTKHKTKTKKTKNTTQYVLNITIHKTQDEDTKQKTQPNLCWTSLYTRRRQTKQKHITICVGHHYM